MISIEKLKDAGKNVKFINACGGGVQDCFGGWCSGDCHGFDYRLL